jgi:mannosyl-oligosaccharide glucosidase
MKLSTLQLAQALALVFGLAQGPSLADAAEQHILSDSHLFDKEHARTLNASLLWGPYRPNLYMGVKPRLDRSLLTGLIWARVDDFQTAQNSFRHSCEQSDDMAGYGWEEYDARTGGRQVVYDRHNGIDLVTEFAKTDDGLHWGLRVKGQLRQGTPKDLKSTIVFYIANEGLGEVEVTNERDAHGVEGDVELKGRTPDLGAFSVTVTAPPGFDFPAPLANGDDEKPLDRTLVRSVTEMSSEIWQAKEYLFREIKAELDILSQKYQVDNHPPPWRSFTIKNDWGKGNLHFIQKVFEGPFEFDVLYSSDLAGKQLTSKDLTVLIEKNDATFGSQFTSVFPRASAFAAKKFDSFAKTLFSNLLGGIGYFHGNSLVDRSYAEEFEEEGESFWIDAAEARARHAEAEEGPSSLFTSVPSRPFFPRGFLWDEGFHLIPILEWDTDIALEIVRSWFNLMDDDGWIGREQILGAEARSKVPTEFQIQYPHYANPPTLFFVVEAYLDKLLKLQQNASYIVDFAEFGDSLPNSFKDPVLAKNFLKNLYPLLKRHYYWFRKTQIGDMRTYDRPETTSKEAYRWRGRTETHVLTSGLDDYPRASSPHPGELHVDLLSWIGNTARVLHKVSSYLSDVGDSDNSEEYTEDMFEFNKHMKGITENLQALHWSEKEGAFCDATIDGFEEHALVCNKGYISLFPYLLHLLEPTSAFGAKTLEKSLDLILDPSHLWSDHGLRSLSKSHDLFGKDENYWRGNIWININYLTVRAARHYYNILSQQELGASTSKDVISSKDRQNLLNKLAKVANNLNKNVISTVYGSWKETGFAWEQYDEATGKGRRTAHFTGWTSLVVQMIGWENLPVSN